MTVLNIKKDLLTFVKEVLLSINTVDTLIHQTESLAVPTMRRMTTSFPPTLSSMMELPLYLRTSHGCLSLVFQGDCIHLITLSQVPDLSSVEQWPWQPDGYHPCVSYSPVGSRMCAAVLRAKIAPKSPPYNGHCKVAFWWHGLSV